MINRDNWKLVKQFLEYRLSIEQISSSSLHTEKTYVRYLLEWAQETPFIKGASIRPALPEFMLSARLDGLDRQLSAVHITKTLATGRRFYNWLRDYQQGYLSVKPVWINSISLKRLPSAPVSREAVSFAEILAIASAPVENTPERRIRAAAVFWYLSGIRIGAFVSLPIKAVDLEQGTIKQHPELGVRTKNKKHATTNLLPIPELLSVVQEWDTEVRAKLPENGYWFAPLRSDTGEIDTETRKIGEHRHNLARKNLQAWLKKAGLPFHTPHKFRHGHVHWGLSHSKDMADFKAVSENVMHSNLSITDRVYSNLKETQLSERIAALSEIPKYSSDKDNLLRLLEETLEALRGQDNSQ